MLTGATNGASNPSTNFQFTAILKTFDGKATAALGGHLLRHVIKSFRLTVEYLIDTVIKSHCYPL